MKLIIYTFILYSIVSSVKAQPMYFPPTTGTTWDTVTPAKLNWCQERIDTLYNYLQQRNTDAFIVLKEGKIVLEKYFGTYTADSIHFWASAGKSLTAALVGIAQEKGFLNINNTASSYLGNGWSSSPLVKENQITVKQLLSMTSGLEDNVTTPCTNEDTDKVCLQYLADAGTRWSYHTGAYKKLQTIVSTTSGLSYNAFTNNYIENHIGMNGAWFNQVYFSKARDMARFGLLMLNKGIWDTDTLLHNTSYYNDMITTSQSYNLSYGYLWWLNGQASVMVPTLQTVFPGPLVPNAPSDMFCALGKYDQKIYIIPSQKLVVIRQGESAYSNSQALSTFDNILWNYLSNMTCPTSINESAKNEFNFYPNPTTHILHVELKSEKSFLIKISNELGQVLLQSKSNDIDVSMLSQGIYFITIQQENSIVTKKFIKQ